MAPKTSQADWLKCRIDFEAGNYTSIVELAERYGINKDTLSSRIHRYKWHAKVAQTLQRIEAKVEERKENMVSEYLLSSFSRMKKYEKIIDASLENLGSKNLEGIPILDPEAIDQFTRSEGRINSIACNSLRIPQASQLDITSKGKSIGESLVSAIAKMRQDGKGIDISATQVAQIAEFEVVPDSPQQ